MFGLAIIATRKWGWSWSGSVEHDREYLESPDTKSRGVTMGNAVWLFLELPRFFFTMALSPFMVGPHLDPLTSIPLAGIICLAAGSILGIRKRAVILWKFGLLILTCQALVLVAGLLRGLLDISVAQAVLLLFMLGILGWSALLIYRAKGVRFPALLIAVFTILYASAASFLSAMSFTDDWL